MIKELYGECKKYNFKSGFWIFVIGFIIFPVFAILTIIILALINSI